MRDVRHGDASSANPMSSNQSECENGLTTVNREGRWYYMTVSVFLKLELCCPTLLQPVEPGHACKGFALGERVIAQQP